jgi:hypothetical protein
MLWSVVLKENINCLIFTNKDLEARCWVESLLALTGRESTEMTLLLSWWTQKKRSFCLSLCLNNPYNTMSGLCKYGCIQCIVGVSYSVLDDVIWHNHSYLYVSSILFIIKFINFSSYHSSWHWRMLLTGQRAVYDSCSVISIILWKSPTHHPSYLS